MLKRKNPAAYQVKRSAVKKTQKEKRGIANTRHTIPLAAANFGLRLNINKANTTKNAISCIFIMFNLK